MSNRRTARPLRSIRASLLRNQIVLLGVLSGAFLLITFYASDRVRLAIERSTIDHSMERVQLRLHQYLDPVESLAKLVRDLSGYGAFRAGDPDDYNRILMAMIRDYEEISSINFGDERGRGFLLVRLGDRWHKRKASSRFTKSNRSPSALFC